ncbi:MAG: hypothetical protein IKQ87_03260, partial [Clostridia bacterium]|nr:hypothetical protein [Clostridia bacterium]
MNKQHKIVDIVCLALVGVIFGGTALWNAVQPDRPTISESEKRTLATMPAFSFSSLADGSYFAGISAFISDTFVGREQLVGLSKKLDMLTGVDYSIGGEENFVLLNPTSEKPREEENTDAISAAFDALLNGGGQEEEPDPGHPEEPGGEPQTAPETDPPEAEAPETEAPETEAPDDREPDEVPESPDEKREEAGEPAEPAEEGKPDDRDDPDDPEHPETPDTLDAGDGNAEEETEPAEPEPEEPAVTALQLSRDKMSLTVGSGSV